MDSGAVTWLSLRAAPRREEAAVSPCMALGAGTVCGMLRGPGYLQGPQQSRRPVTLVPALGRGITSIQDDAADSDLCVQIASVLTLV